MRLRLTAFESAISVGDIRTEYDVVENFRIVSINAMLLQLNLSPTEYSAQEGRSISSTGAIENKHASHFAIPMTV